MGLNITVMSYCGSLDFGLVADRDQMPDLRLLLRWLEESLDALAGDNFALKEQQMRAARPFGGRGAGSSMACLGNVAPSLFCRCRATFS
jgi:hypothetical protein